MPFVAMVKRPEDAEFERVNIEDHEAPRQEFIDHDIQCPGCDAKMHVRHSIRDRPYFQHNVDPGGSCDYTEKEGESPEHRASKKMVIASLMDHPAYGGAVIVEEFALQTEQRKRIADIYVRHIDGAIEIHEAQLAAITTEKLEERTRDYLTVSGVQSVLWWLGNNADNERNRNWCRDYCGQVAFIETETKDGSDVIGPVIYRDSPLGSRNSNSIGDHRMPSAGSIGEAYPEQKPNYSNGEFAIAAD